MFSISDFTALRRIHYGFFPPIPLIRKNIIVKQLLSCGATSEETAKTLAEAGAINPNGFKRITERLISMRIIHRTSDGRYYV